MTPDPRVAQQGPSRRPGLAPKLITRETRLAVEAHPGQPCSYNINIANMVQGRQYCDIVATMYLRLTKVRRGSRTYRYAQLVESFRRPDGSPTNRVLANLGELDDLAVDNLRAALDASRHGQALALTTQPVAPPRACVLANLRYLDLAVLLHLWQRLGLHELLARALPSDDRTVDAAQVVAALVLQRCVSPASKLAAERWYPTTALPELQGIAPAQFNNSRLHRVLAALEVAEPSLQSALAPTVQKWAGAFSALFLDATDTWFVGRGPPLAHKGRDKEGVYRRRVGLVLLCDGTGHPLRWRTLSGDYHDSTALLELARQVAELPWTRNVPLVLDRAVGNAGGTETLDALGLRYVTALPDPELQSSGVPLPWEVLDALQSESSVEAIERRLADAGCVADGKGRWLLDLGVFDKARPAQAGRVSTAISAMDVLDALDVAPSTAVAAARLGMSPRHVRHHFVLKPLGAVVRDRLRHDHEGRLAMNDLVAIAQAPVDQQSTVLDQLLARPDQARRSARSRARSTYRARAVLCVSPERVLSDRRSDEEHRAKVQTLAADVTHRLAHPSNRRTDASALAEVEQYLRRFGLGGVLRVQLVAEGSQRKVVLQTDDDAWARRRRGDGINVIVSHPDVAGDAAHIVGLYFSKDAIERDFRTIKSVVELRPIHHRTDPKVRAHVTVCILALLLLRALEAALQHSATATSVIESLEPIRLNLVSQAKSPFYTVTHPEPAAAALLHQLDLTHLVDDLRIAGAITPRT